MGRKLVGEAFVFAGEEELPFRYKPVSGSVTSVRSRWRSDLPEAVRYEEGKDYIVDYETGTIRRTPESRIADARLHPMYGVQAFNHNEYSDFSNASYTVYVDYESETAPAETTVATSDIERSGFLDRLVRKLQAGEEAVYVVYGDSISTGGEASEESLAYFGRFAEALRSLYPQGRLRIVNKAIGGEDTGGGISRVDADVVALLPDLVSIGYGMNDQNVHEDGSHTTSLEQFDRNLRGMIDAIRSAGDTDIVLVTPCEPNPDWQHTSGQTPLYADVIRHLGREYGIGVADAHAEWTAELAAGKTPASLLLNNINHPNDYGHQIYSESFFKMLVK